MRRPLACPPRAPSALLTLAAGLALSLVPALVPGPAAAQPRPACASCHGELEFLRQHTATLDDARALLVPADTVAASAHAGMACAECHGGYGTFPHRGAGTTESCSACHEEVDDSWTEGEHAREPDVSCASCHGVHAVRTAEELSAPEGARAMRTRCATCHFEPRIPDDDPHADSVSCSGCHEAHRTLSPADPASAVHPSRQAETCAGCHEEVVRAWTDDAHGRAVRGEGEGGSHDLEPPTCTACHGAHGMLTPGAGGFPGAMVTRCAECHEPYAESFADSYHGQASTLGSEKVATCHDCHGAHGVYGADHPESTVGEAKLVETCQSCHPAAGAGFVLFQPHADHHDREAYPYVYWSYHLMTALLIGVFAVFGAHTALWLGRLGVQALRDGAARAQNTPKGD